MAATTKSWSLPSEELRAPTPVRARDLIVECFFHAQRETFARSAEKLGKRPDDDALRKNVTAAVRGVVRDVGGNWDRPTVADLRQAVQLLGERAGSWGTPPDIVQHHGAQIMRLLTACEAAQRR